MQTSAALPYTKSTFNLEHVRWLVNIYTQNCALDLDDKQLSMSHSNII